MEALSGQSFIPSNLGRVDEEMIPTARGVSQTLVKTVPLSNALHCLETVKTYLMQQDVNDTVFSYLHKVEKRALSSQESK
ncbi:hypothetical protein TNCV_4107781 [Trichonephila clavipes]|nr:hypothetical protein TNCV_4107781 [Trichonephila clavipes]